MAKGRGILWLFVLAAFVVTPFIFDFRDPLSILRKGERIVNIDLAQLKKMQAANDIQLIDVREPVELEEAGRIPGATNIPLGDVEEAFLMDSETFLKTYNIKKPKKSDANIVFTCRSGVRSLRAVKIVEELGYK
ncbi:putative secreted salivary gland peptide [Paragonimus heterotremus]|uniref:Putative secreted salivary gland peptide n=1 Tax=Paragonimus heterotremus TaxID=100268 RepID=A0A8J4T0X9_9TREM|nr:putative secreted salivary gland peptide [Paragonimus heterotremus]